MNYDSLIIGKGGTKMVDKKILDFQDINERFAAEEQANDRVLEEQSPKQEPTLIIRHGENIRDRFKLDREKQLLREQDLRRIQMLKRGLRQYE